MALIVRGAFAVVLALTVLAAPLAAEGQPAAKVYRIGYLAVPSRASMQHVANAFEGELRDLGWVEGQNVVVEYRFAESSSSSSKTHSLRSG